MITPWSGRATVRMAAASTCGPPELHPDAVMVSLARLDGVFGLGGRRGHEVARTSGGSYGSQPSRYADRSSGPKLA
jgi:hypothetical protein